MCGVGMDRGMYKPMKPSQITKSERDVQKILRVLAEDYINPFGVDFEKEYLVCLNSREPVSDEIANSILSVPRQGRIFYEKHLLKSISNWEQYHSMIVLNRIALSFSVMQFQDKEVPKKQVVLM